MCDINHEKAKPRQYGLRALCLLTLICACCTGITSFIVNQRKLIRQRNGLGIQESVANLSLVLRQLVERDNTLQNGLLPCGLTNGFDQCSICGASSLMLR